MTVLMRMVSAVGVWATGVALCDVLLAQPLQTMWVLTAPQTTQNSTDAKHTASE